MPATRRGRLWAGSYLVLVAGTVVFVLARLTVIHGADDGASLSPIWLIFVTLPWSMLLASASRLGRTLPAVVLIVGLAVAAALNAFLLGRAGDASTRG